MTALLSSRSFRVLTLLAAALVGTLFVASQSAFAAVTATGPTTGGTPVTIDGLRFTQIDAGMSVTYGLTSDGTVYAWGTSGYGVLGNGTTTGIASTPVQVLGVGGSGVLTGIVQVAAGDRFALALADDGTVYAWGNGEMGPLGNGVTTGA